MTGYTELVKALRRCSVDEYVPCKGCPMDEETHGTGCFNIMHQRAAAAIEELQALLTEADKKQTYQHDCICELTAENEELQQIADHYEQTTKDYWKEACEYKAQLPKRGEWIIVDEWKNTLGDKLMKIKCPFCNQQIKLYEQPMPKYCDSCGAKMEVQE